MRVMKWRTNGQTKHARASGFNAAMSGRLRLATTRILGGLSYNLAACAYILILAVVLSAVLPHMVTQGGEGQTPLEGIAVLQYAARASLLMTIIGSVVAFVIGAVSLVLLVWVPVKIAKVGSYLTRKISVTFFVNPTDGFHMFIAKLLLYGPAIIILIILYLVVSSELVFQILVSGTALVLAAVVCAALRLAVFR